MKILCHRGAWVKEEEKNTVRALLEACNQGYGIETDLRDYMGKLVISHNVAEHTSVPFEEFLIEYRKANFDTTLALNVKADGIQPLLKEMLERYQIDNYFMFDMSVPEQVIYVRDEFHTFTRQSEYEQLCSMYEQTEGVWMDEFAEPWMSVEHIERHLRNGKKVGIISPEIHGNDVIRIWDMVKLYRENDNLMLCTDIPKKAMEYIYG